MSAELIKPFGPVLIDCLGRFDLIKDHHNFVRVDVFIAEQYANKMHWMKHGCGMTIRRFCSSRTGTAKMARTPFWTAQSSISLVKCSDVSIVARTAIVFQIVSGIGS